MLWNVVLHNLYILLDLRYKLNKMQGSKCKSAENIVKTKFD